MPAPGVEVKLAPMGELLVRDECVMRRYRNQPERTAESLSRDGWFETGDVAAIDDDGDAESREPRRCARWSPATRARRGWTRSRASILTGGSGRSGWMFYDTLLDENAANHIALGQDFDFAVGEDECC